MKKTTFLLLIALFGCNNSNENLKTENKEGVPKTASQLEEESIKSGIVSDSLILNCFFGMSQSQFDKLMIKHTKNNSVQINEKNSILSYSDTKSYGFYRNTNYEFHNDELFRTTTYIYPNQIEKKKKTSKNFEKELIDKIKEDNKIGDPLTGGTQNSKYYWLIGNKRIDLFDTLKMHVLVTSDMSREKIILAEINAEEQNQLKLDQIEDQKVFDKLKKNAERDWPNDYTTQEFWINQQKEDYAFMKSISNDDPIKRKAQRDWPLDFTTQKFWYNEQIEAKERLK